MEKNEKSFQEMIKELFENRELFAKLIIDSSPEKLIIEDVEHIFEIRESTKLIIMKKQGLGIQEAFGALSKYFIAWSNGWELEDMRNWKEFTDEERIQIISEHWISGFYDRNKLCLEEIRPRVLIKKHDLKGKFRDYRIEIEKLTDAIIIDNDQWDSMYFSMSNDIYLLLSYCFYD